MGTEGVPGQGGWVFAAGKLEIFDEKLCMLVSANVKTINSGLIIEDVAPNKIIGGGTSPCPRSLRLCDWCSVKYCVLIRQSSVNQSCVASKIVNDCETLRCTKTHRFEIKR